MALSNGQIFENRLKRLARNIEALAEKDQDHMRRAREVAQLRRAASAELHAACLDFVSAVNRLLSHGEISLDPPEFSPAMFRDGSRNLVQMNVRGRILQVQYESTPQLISTEDFRIPYILEGSVRAFNQELLEKDLIEEQLIFYTLEKPRNLWRFFDGRTYRSGPFGQEYLVSLMEQLI